VNIHLEGTCLGGDTRWTFRTLYAALRKGMSEAGLLTGRVCKLARMARIKRHLERVDTFLSDVIAL
jgi:hypothetical protein